MNTSYEAKLRTILRNGITTVSGYNERLESLDKQLDSHYAAICSKLKKCKIKSSFKALTRAVSSNRAAFPDRDTFFKNINLHVKGESLNDEELNELWAAISSIRGEGPGKSTIAEILGILDKYLVFADRAAKFIGNLKDSHHEGSVNLKKLLKHANSEIDFLNGKRDYLKQARIKDYLKLKLKSRTLDQFTKTERVKEKLKVTDCRGALAFTFLLIMLTVTNVNAQYRNYISRQSVKDQIQKLVEDTEITVNIRWMHHFGYYMDREKLLSDEDIETMIEDYVKYAFTFIGSEFRPKHIDVGLGLYENQMGGSDAHYRIMSRSSAVLNIGYNILQNYAKKSDLSLLLLSTIIHETQHCIDYVQYAEAVDAETRFVSWMNWLEGKSLVTRRVPGSKEEIEDVTKYLAIFIDSTEKRAHYQQIRFLEYLLRTNGDNSGFASIIRRAIESTKANLARVEDGSYPGCSKEIERARDALIKAIQ